MKNYTWYIDMDDTICDYSGQFNEDLNLEPKIAYPQSQYGFYSKLKPLPNAIESILELDSMGEDVWILTRPSEKNPLCYIEKFIWIKEHLGIKFARRLILCTDKGRVGTESDYLIDDFNWKSGEKFKNDETKWKGTQILFGRGNTMNWTEVMKYIKSNVLKVNKKLLIIGSARHGKDTFAEILNEAFGYKYASSSQAASDIFIYDTLKDKYGYKTPEECFEDRVNHREEWYELICWYNRDDKARLAKEILTRTDCYVGMRDSGEIEECMRQGLFDIIIWVDASERLPREDEGSFKISEHCADIFVTNNGTREEFVDKVLRIGKLIIN